MCSGFAVFQIRRVVRHGHGLVEGVWAWNRGHERAVPILAELGKADGDAERSESVAPAQIEQPAAVDRLSGVDHGGLAVQRKAGAALDRSSLRLCAEVDVDEHGRWGLRLSDRG